MTLYAISIILNLILIFKKDGYLRKEKIYPTQFATTNCTMIV